MDYKKEQSLVPAPVNVLADVTVIFITNYWGLATPVRAKQNASFPTSSKPIKDHHHRDHYYSVVSNVGKDAAHRSPIL